MSEFFTGLVAGVLIGGGLVSFAIVTIPRIQASLRAWVNRPQYRRTPGPAQTNALDDLYEQRALRREASKQEWLDAFLEARPAIDMSTPAGRAEAEAAMAREAREDSWPRWKRREMGLL